MAALLGGLPFLGSAAGRQRESERLLGGWKPDWVGDDLRGKGSRRRQRKIWNAVFQCVKLRAGIQRRGEPRGVEALLGVAQG